jgi:hypothetical protein
MSRFWETARIGEPSTGKRGAAAKTAAKGRRIGWQHQDGAGTFVDRLHASADHRERGKQSAMDALARYFTWLRSTCYAPMCCIGVSPNLRGRCAPLTAPNLGPVWAWSVL